MPYKCITCIRSVVGIIIFSVIPKMYSSDNLFHCTFKEFKNKTESQNEKNHFIVCLKSVDHNNGISRRSAMRLQLPSPTKVQKVLKIVSVVSIQVLIVCF